MGLTEPFTRRAAAWDTTGLPVPAELLVYTLVEWERLCARGGRFAETVRSQREWLVL